MTNQDRTWRNNLRLYGLHQYALTIQQHGKEGLGIYGQTRMASTSTMEENFTGNRNGRTDTKRPTWNN